MAKEQEYTIAPNNKYKIICPYCFNLASGGSGEPFSHTQVEFRSESFFETVYAMETKLGFKESEIDLISNKSEREAKRKQYETYRRFLLKTSPKYENFWADFDGTTEEPENQGTLRAWELPIIREGTGVKTLRADIDGFVSHAVDEFGEITHRRVCPHCHNPLPMGYGKNSVKYISIIGIQGAGKTVYISQLLSRMRGYAAKSGLNAYFTAETTTVFCEKNRVAKGAPVPPATSPKRFSQPMFYDIVRDVNNKKHTDTIVLYDIAGENCRNAQMMVNFSKFVKNSDGIILLVDPKQLNFITGIEGNVDEPAMALNTLHNILVTQETEKSSIPIAVCISKSDACANIVPPLALEDVNSAEPNEIGLPKQEFDAKTYNALSAEIKTLMQRNAPDVCTNLNGEFLNFNFFTVSAIGCSCEDGGEGFKTPIRQPEPRRIEEPILWLFKQFGFIKANEPVVRPFKIRHETRYRYEKPFMRSAYLVIDKDYYSETEEDPVVKESLVWYKDHWEPISEFTHLKIK